MEGQCAPASVAFLFGNTGDGSTGQSGLAPHQLDELVGRAWPRLWFFVLLGAGFAFVPLALITLFERTGLRSLLEVRPERGLPGRWVGRVG